VTTLVVRDSDGTETHLEPPILWSGCPRRDDQCAVSVRRHVCVERQVGSSRAEPGCCVGLGLGPVDTPVKTRRELEFASESGIEKGCRLQYDL
jgi:hypothetical protein